MTYNVTKKQDDLSKRPIGKIALRDKIFVERNSPIEDLMKNEHMVAVYSLFLAIIVGLITHTAAYDYFYKGQINFGQRLVINQLWSFPTFWCVWIPIFLSNFLVYYGFRCWANVRTSLAPNSPAVKSWDYFWLGLVVTYYPVWLYLTTWASVGRGISTVLLIAVHADTTRMLMKIHSFIRSNVPRVLSYKPHTENIMLYPTVSHFMYYLWAPTLIYRDTYPRTTSIRWSYVASKALEFVLVLFLFSVIMERYLIHSFQDYGIKPYSWVDIILITLGNASGGMLLMIAGNYILLHVWLNAYAEVCRFGDRLFYEDWWTSKGYERYYRTWNIVVHDWLYTYVYKDFYEIVAPGNRVVAKYAVFLLSAIFHEYVLGFGFRFFQPILFIQFATAGALLSYVKIKPAIIGNILMLYTLGMGNSINATFFAIEYYSRVNCPIENPTVYSYLVPRWWSCG